jgi:hypothetical protein
MAEIAAITPAGRSRRFLFLKEYMMEALRRVDMVVVVGWSYL